VGPGLDGGGTVRDPLSEIARKAMSVTENRCRKQGLDFAEELNRLGLLATEPRIREIQVSALKNMLARLEMMSVADLMEVQRRGNSNPGTPADLYVSVLGWIHNYINHLTT